jgi:hypothetical protein
MIAQIYETQHVEAKPFLSTPAAFGRRREVRSFSASINTASGPSAGLALQASSEKILR